jgi:vacuolar-type H+-ATPase subunit H
MSLEAIKMVTQSESLSQERKAAAEAEARQLVAAAERDGIALAQRIRTEAAEKGKAMLEQAEERAANQAAAIAKDADADAAALQAAAEKRLEEAVEFIVGRVVKH